MGQFGLAIIFFTVLLRLATLPLTINTYRSMKSMQAIQPKIQEIQKKYKDPKRRNEERAKLMRESGFNPLGCLFPMLIQIVPFFALFRRSCTSSAAARRASSASRSTCTDLRPACRAVPLNQHFLWLDLGQPDPYFIMPLLVFVTTYVTAEDDEHRRHHASTAAATADDGLDDADDVRRSSC